VDVESTMTEDTWSVRGDDDDESGGPSHLHYRASLAYSSPIYPQSWTVAVQQLHISIPLRHLPGSAAVGHVERGECFKVGRKVFHAGGWSERRWPFKARGEMVGVKGDQAIGIGADGRWCVLAGEDNQIQVYALPSAVNDGRQAAAALSSDVDRTIRHSQTLLAHSAAITSISLRQGRCVSAGRDGRVLVWELDDSAAAAEALEAEELEMLGRLRTVADRAREDVKPVEVRDAGTTTTSPRRSKKEIPVVDGSEEEVSEVSVSEASAAPVLSSSADPYGTRALRRQLLPRPPPPHPLSVAGIAKEYNLRNPPPVIDAEVRSTSTGPIIRNITFNHDTIAALVETVDDEPDALEEYEQVVPGSSRDRHHPHSFVKVWRFDV